MWKKIVMKKNCLSNGDFSCEGEGNEEEIGNNDEAINKDNFNSFSIDHRQPLFMNSPLTLEESIFSTYIFSVRNKLSYQATTQLLQLMQIHFPKPNEYPPSLHKLDKHFKTMKQLQFTKFCQSCMAKLPQEEKHCKRMACGKTSESNFALLPFENELADICSGKVLGNYHTCVYSSGSNTGCKIIIPVYTVVAVILVVK